MWISIVSRVDNDDGGAAGWPRQRQMMEGLQIPWLWSCQTELGYDMDAGFEVGIEGTV